MTLKDTIHKIDELQRKIDAFGKLDRDTLNKVNYKFRLDWNYHSNAMEGNSLTQQETRTVMVGVAVISGKPVKDIIEMQGHDVVITDMLKIGRGDVRVSEKRIKDIHRQIVHEDNPEEKAKVGQWKTVNNYLHNYRGERFDFSPYEQVPEEMHELLNWFNAEVDKIKNGQSDAMHPAILAFEFHYRYVTIHPFHDGNGRTGRILTNLILISFGYPPIIIKLEEKANYGKYLSDIQSYGGSPDLYYEFMGERLIQSQNLVLKAIKGEPIDEPNDLDKGIELLKKSLAISPDEVRKSTEVLKDLWENSLKYLNDELTSLYKRFTELFDVYNSHITISHGNSSTSVRDEVQVIGMLTNTERINRLTAINFIFSFNQMRQYAYSTSLNVSIHFTSVSYEITNNRTNRINKLYSEQLTKEEIDGFVTQTGKAFLEELNKVTAKPEK